MQRLQKDPFTNIPYFNKDNVFVISTTNNGTDIIVPMPEGSTKSDIISKKQELRLYLKEQYVLVKYP